MKYQMFFLFVLFSVSTSFAQSQETPTGQQTQHAPPPTANSTPSVSLASAQSTDKQSESQESVASPTFTYGAEIDFNSGYVWRGLLLDDGFVAQPSAWISAYGFTFTAWSNMAMTSASGGLGSNAAMAMTSASGGPGSNAAMGMTNASGGPGSNAAMAMTSASIGRGPNAADFLLTYDHEWEKLRIEAGLDSYLGRQSSNFDTRNTMEGSLEFSYPIGPLRLYTTHAFDVLAYRGSYFGEARLEHERHVTKCAEITISLRTGWASAKFNQVYIGVNKSAFNFAGAEGSLTYSFGQHMFLMPHIEFSSITDRRLRAQLSPSNIVNFGIAFGFRK
jgi:outer membrane scaffolding protein for murein synthesis (MipA/OmpV family)